MKDAVAHLHVFVERASRVKNMCTHHRCAPQKGAWGAAAALSDGVMGMPSERQGPITLSSSEGRSTRDVGSSQAVLSHALAFAAPCISPQFALAGVAFSSPAVRATSVILVLAQASLLMEFVNFLFKPILRTTGCFRNAGCTGLWPAISMECLTTLVRPALEETPVLPRIKQTVYSRCSAVKSVGKLSIIVLGHFPPREEDLQPGRLTCEAVPRNCFGSNSYGLSVRLSTRITVRRSPAPNSVCVITTQSAISRESVTHELQSVDRQVGRETFTRTST